MSEFSASPERLILGALLGFAVLLFLIIKVKIQPFIAIMSSALIIGIAVGMPFSMITDTIAEGVGTTLQTIAILIGLGSMFGAILQVSGGVEVIADTLLKVFGEKRAPWALGITGLIVGMPVFFESGLLILIPVAFGIARKTKKSVFCYSIPLLAGLAIGHAFVPPTPGPVLVAEMLNVQLSYVIMLGIVIGIPAMILAGPVFGKFVKNLSAVLIHAERKFGVPLHSPDEPFIRQAYGLRQSILRDGHSRQPRRKRSHLTVKNKTEKSCATSLSVVLIMPQRAADCKPLHRRVAALEALIRRQGRIFVVQLPQQHGTAHHADEHIAVIHHRHKVLFDGCL